MLLEALGGGTGVLALERSNPEASPPLRQRGKVGSRHGRAGGGHYRETEARGGERTPQSHTPTPSRVGTGPTAPGS